ncbi:hypothetical protein [Globicatella sp. PHS-GS-PNBC-21-1553]|uniref:hypothetical protein n=1 Tax=Globicatella sp. PHS-GS-PNBC-21-1553 TaxID=2885764 RepID=UPI00298F2436|nr:hypothetical protein [Globicatella sp. PHS-GS-PNBC-21-1553]WPC08008.1 hypothetical protein LB888_08110 [Globicatella sp. PHS-GS-PNBC-21-1553]
MDIKAVIHQILSGIEPNCHYEVNKALHVVYPYTTYLLTFERIDLYTEGIYIDLQIFDHSTSLVKLYEVEKRLKNVLNNTTKQTPAGFLTFKFIRSNSVKTGDETIKRLDIQFYVYANRFEIEPPRIDDNE